MPTSSCGSTRGRTSICRDSGLTIRTATGGKRWADNCRPNSRPRRRRWGQRRRAREPRDLGSGARQLRVDRVAQGILPGRAGKAGHPRLHHAEYRQRPGQLDDPRGLAVSAGVSRVGASPPQHGRAAYPRGGGAAAGRPHAEEAGRRPRIVPLQDAEAHECIQPAGRCESGSRHHDRGH